MTPFSEEVRKIITGDNKDVIRGNLGIMLNSEDINRIVAALISLMEERKTNG